MINVTAASNPKSPGDWVGKPIGGKYLVRGVLGEGEKGTVFEAEHTTIGRLVAVKVLRPPPARGPARGKDAVRRFHREARAAAAIGHPNICEIYDVGELEDGSSYLVMERLFGETLAERIAVEGGLPFDDVVDVLVQVLSALAAAHEKGIVHRDVRPENVFLKKQRGPRPLVKVLDFGVSKMMASAAQAAQEEVDATRNDIMMGTPYCLSPEQARGDRDLDPRVDVYACGVILYEALTGCRPFVAASYDALLLQILSSSPRPAGELRPTLPGGFGPVVARAMTRDREKRYQTAGELERDLNALRAPHPPVAAKTPNEASAPAFQFASDDDDAAFDDNPTEVKVSTFFHVREDLPIPPSEPEPNTAERPGFTGLRPR